MSGMMRKGETCPFCAEPAHAGDCGTPAERRAVSNRDRAAAILDIGGRMGESWTREAITDCLDAAERRRPAEADRRELLASVILEHMRTNTSGCACGGVALGHSYPHHLADVLIKAGL